MSVRWYLVHSQSQGEDRADVNLRRQAFVTYLHTEAFSNALRKIAG
jgi:hypothetical protein